ncbi:MAG: hypothetical protein RRZ67_02295 [Victivallaceae bacterium]
MFTYTLLSRFKRFVISKFYLKNQQEEDALSFLLLDCLYQAVQSAQESDVSVRIFSEICDGMSNDLKIDIKKKSFQNVDPSVRSEDDFVSEEILDLEKSTVDIGLSDLNEDDSEDRENFYKEELQEDNAWLREHLVVKMQDCRAHENLIAGLKRDLTMLSQRLEIAEGRRLCYENQIKSLEEQLEFLIMDKAGKESEVKLSKENLCPVDSERITAYIKLLEQKDDLLTVLRDENLSLKKRILDLTNRLDKLTSEKECEVQDFRERADHLKIQLESREQELELSRKKILHLRDLEHDFKDILLELEILRDQKQQVSDPGKTFIKLKERLSERIEEMGLLQQSIETTQGSLEEVDATVKDEDQNFEKVHDKNVKFEATLNDLRDFLNRKAEEEGIESLLSNETDNYL